MHQRCLRADLVALAAALLVLAAVIAAGAVLNERGVPIFADAAPVFGSVLPHLGPGTPVALLLAFVVVAYGPGLSDRLPWRRVLALAYLAALVWMISLAMVDGWQHGIAGRLTDWTEYLHDVPRVTDIPAMMATFTDHILIGTPGNWTVHVSGHPPGVLLWFVWLDRIGLGGGAWAAVSAMLIGALAAVAVPLTVRELAGERSARAMLPFVVLFPGAVWMAVSADGLFTGVTATGLALLAVAARPGRAPLGLLAGVLLGFALFLSYGLTLMLPLVGAVLLGTRGFRALCWAAAAAAVVVAAFAWFGFWWPAGYELVVQRYYQGEIAQRPYSYWVFGNLGAFLLATGPLAAVGLRRAVTHLGQRAGWLVLAAGVAVLAADLSGLSKAEVERIWLPFAVWFTCGGALLPTRHRRWWLSGQALTALAVNHLIMTNW